MLIDFSLQEAEKAANIYESDPTTLHTGTTHEKIMNLRPREEDKEIAGNMQYQPNTTV